jgi:protein phosphatase
VTSPRTGRSSADAAGGEASVELTRRCRHAAAAVGDLIFMYGGLRGGESSIEDQFLRGPPCGVCCSGISARF